MARRFARTRVVARSDRKPVWLGLQFATTAIGTSNALIGSLNAAALALRPFTIVRTRAVIQFESDQVAASETARGAFGIIVVSDQAVAAGAASIPNPFADTDAQFFVWEGLVNSFVLGDATGFTEPSGTSLVVDSKAMRKVGLNEDIAVMAVVATAAGINLTVAGRMLIKLH